MAFCLRCFRWRATLTPPAAIRTARSAYHVPETHVIPLLLDVAAGASDRFTPFGDDYPTVDGTCIRNYIHVSDLADAHVQAVRALLGGAESAALNIGTGRGWSVRDLVDCARQVTNRDIPVQVGPRRPGDPPVLIVDPTLARHRLGPAASLCRSRDAGDACLGLAAGRCQKLETDAAAGREDRVALNGIP